MIFFRLILSLFFLIPPLLVSGTPMSPAETLPPIDTLYTVDMVPNVQLSNSLDFVSDPNSLIEQEYKDTINFILKMLRDSASVECAVVALPYIEPDDVFDFGYDLFNKWGIGDKDNKGLLLLFVARTPGKRDIRFEVGYGLEGTLPDALCKRIQLNEMVPYMKDGNFGAGLLNAVRSINRICRGEFDANQASYIEDNTLTGKDKMIGILIIVFIWLMCGLFRVFSIVGPVKKAKKSTAKDKIKNYVTYREATKLSKELRLGIIYLPIYIIYIIWKQNGVKNHFDNLITCDSCGNHSFSLSKPKIEIDPKDSDKRIKKYTLTCKKCGKTIPFTTKYTMPSSTSRSHSSSSNGSSWGGGSSSSSGGSWGGGSSGGGGASTRF